MRRCWRRCRRGAPTLLKGLGDGGNGAGGGRIGRRGLNSGDGMRLLALYALLTVGHATDDPNLSYRSDAWHRT